MRHADGGIGRVHALAAVATRAEDVDAQILLGDLEVVVRLVRLGEHDDRGGGRVDAPLRLRHRHALHAVPAALEAERTVGPVAHDRKEDFLVAVERSLGGAHHVHLPALRLAVTRVHAEEVTCEQRRLVAARSGAHLEDGAAALQRIRRQQARQHGPLRVRDLALQTLDFALRLLGEVGILQQRLVPLDVVEDLEIALRRRLQLSEGGVLAHRLAVALRVRNDIWIAHRGLHRGQTIQHLRDLLLRDQGLLRELRVALLEHVDAAFGVDHRLLAREVRVARRAGVHLHLGLRGAGVDDVAARARDGGVAVLRMDTVFHASTFRKKLSTYHTEF